MRAPGSIGLRASCQPRARSSIFIHHNTLHAFEHLPFEEAARSAAERLGREPFLPESRYREKLTSGRIVAKDVEARSSRSLAPA